MKSLYTFLFAFLFLGFSALSQTFDPTFGTGGQVGPVISGFQPSTFDKAMALQADGKIVVAGYYPNGSNNDFAVMRLNTDGTIDNSFDGDGLKTININYDDYANAIAVQSDGKIVLTGYSYYYTTYSCNCTGGWGGGCSTCYNYYYNVIVVRLNADGTLDNTFDGDGIHILDFGAFENAYSIALQSDGKIIVGGHRDFLALVARLNPNGSLDGSFNGIGYHDGSYGGNVFSVTIQDDNKIIAVGSEQSSAQNFAIARFNANGTLDNSFDGDGKKIVAIATNGEDIAFSVKMQADAKILVAGRTYDYNNSATSYDYAIIRLNGDGSMDNSFDADGKKIIDFNNNYDEGRAVTMQDDGKILVSGFAYSGSYYYMAITRINMDGSLDNNFESDGKFIHDATTNSYANCLIIQPDGKLLAGTNLNGYLGIIRLQIEQVEKTLSCPENVVIDTDQNLCTAVVNNIDPIVSPANAVVNYILEKDGIVIETGTGSASGKTFGKGVTTVIYTLASDETVTCTFTITVNDKQKPAFSCPSNQNVNLSETCQLIVPNLISELTGSDNCGIVTFTQNPVAGASLASSHNQTHNIAIIASDGNGNTQTCAVVLTAKDLTRPTFTCPSNQNVDLNSSCQLIVPNLISELTGSDNCGSVTFMQSPVADASLGSSHNQTHNVVITASDGNGNTQACTVVLTGKDVNKPTITCPAPVTVNTSPGLCTGITTLVPPTVTDNCNSIGNALSFDGGYVDVPDDPLLTPFNEWTIETWVRRTSTGVQQSLIEKYMPVSGTYGYLLRILDNDKAVAGFVFSSFGGYFITGTTTLLPNTWYHLAATVNRTTGEMKLYVNGVLDAQVTSMTGLPTTPSTGSLKLGARGDDANTRLSNGGLMDEVRIWNVERTQTQIQASMNSELSAQSGLVALYHLNQGLAGGTNTGLTTAIDASDNNNNGTLISFALTGPTSNWVSGKSFGLTLTNDAPTTYQIGNTNVTWTATDGSGNSATCIQVVTVVDNEPPTIICAAPVAINTTPGLCTGTTTLSSPTVSDNCNSFGNALSFDGGYVDVPNTASINPHNEWTIETWVKRTTTDVQESLIEKYSPAFGTYGYLLRITGNNAMAGFVISSNSGYFITGSTTILPNIWYHLAATFNRITGELKLYVNGVLDAQLAGITGLPTTPSTGSLKLGARGDDANTRLSNGGLMDEVRIWNVERTQPQIQASMNSELSAQSGLVALYHLNEGLAGGTNTGLTTAADVSGNSNNGTLINFALTGPTSNWVSGKSFGLTLTNDAPTTYQIGNTNVTWTAIDGSGNSATCIQVVTVVDNQQPLITSLVSGNTNRNTNAGVCTYKAVLTEFDATATDNCGVTSLTYALSGATTGTGTTLAGVVFNKGITIVTWTASDGVTTNVTSSFTVTVVDNEKPVITSCPIVPVQCYNANGTYTVPALTATDNCGVQSISYSITGATSRSGNSSNASGLFNPGISSIKWTVTDAGGNMATCITPVVIDKVDATIPDVYPAKITASIGAANTIYIGYGGSSVTLSAQVSSSVSPNSYIYKWTIGSPAGPGFASTPNITVSPTTTTTYYLSIKDNNNCAPLYQVSKQINVINITCGTDKIWVCEPQKNGTYSSRCVSSADKTIRTLKAGWYLGQCPATITATKGVTITTEQSISYSEMTITASPNPTTHSFSIIVHSSNKTEKIAARVVDVLGRVIENRNSITEGQTFKLGENYSVGIYLVEAIQGKERRTLKLIKQ